MTIDKLERVMWLLRKQFPEATKIKNTSVHKAIMAEIGTDPRTYQSNRKALLDLGWIKPKGRMYVQLTDKDLIG